MKSLPGAPIADEQRRKLLAWELSHPVDQDGTGSLYARPSLLVDGQMGVFATSKPKPYQYKRDTTAPRNGFLTHEESDRSWEAKDEIATWTMQVTLGADWFRDDWQGNGQLRPMQDLHLYFVEGKLSQDLKWDDERQQYDFVDMDDRVIFRPFKHPVHNPVPFMNDSIFGLADGDADVYDALDERFNALVMIPCLSKCERDPSKGVLASVWAYPRAGWRWDGEIEQEVTIGYHWPLEDWMIQARAGADRGRGV